MSFCECKADGWCRRYNRMMGGRMRDICGGVNIDLGTSALYREQWSRESEGALYSGPPRPILLKTNQAPGDAVAMTAAIWSLHRAHPGRFATGVDSPWPEVFEHNPHVNRIIPNYHQDESNIVHMHYPAIHRANDRGIHFMQGWCEHLSNSLGVEVPLMTNRPRLYFDTPTPLVGDYWVVCSGGKSDFTNKLWGHHNYQAVVDRLYKDVGFIQIGDDRDMHPKLRGVDYRVGETSLRELFDLVRRARGVLCGVSLLMHVAAALEKPAVVIAGGREPVQWNAYPRQRYIHTIGTLPCCLSGGCWRARVIPLGDGTLFDYDTCARPVKTDGYAIPACMNAIGLKEVVDNILMYEEAYTCLPC